MGRAEQGPLKDGSSKVKPNAQEKPVRPAAGERPAKDEDRFPSNQSLCRFEGSEMSSQEKSEHGGLAQLGERLPCKQEVSGSNPLISTKQLIFTNHEAVSGLIAQLVRAHA